MKDFSFSAFLITAISALIIGIILGAEVQESHDLEEYIRCLEDREVSIINVAGVPKDVTVTIDGCRITAKSLEGLEE